MMVVVVVMMMMMMMMMMMIMMMIMVMIIPLLKHRRSQNWVEEALRFTGDKGCDVILDMVGGG